MTSSVLQSFKKAGSQKGNISIFMNRIGRICSDADAIGQRREGKYTLLLSQVCAGNAQTVKHPAWREALGMDGCRCSSAEG